MRTVVTSPRERIPLHSHSPLAGKIRRAARRWWQAYWDWRARQSTILILQSLDERTLHDIGISPSEIASCVYGKRCDRRRSYHASWRK